MTSDLAEELPHDMTFTFEQSYSGTKPNSVIMPEDGNQVEVMIGNLGTEILAPKVCRDYLYRSWRIYLCH